MGDECVPRPPLLQAAEYLAEAHSRVVSVMERLVASVDARPSARLTLSGTDVHEIVNASDHRPHESARENESERVRGVEIEGDYEKPIHGDVPWRTLRSKEEG